MTRKDWLLVCCSAGITVSLALGLIRWLAPELLGYSGDQIVVRSTREVPPFFEGVFRVDDSGSLEFLLQDPYTKVRGRPLFPDAGFIGPNDILGFRNRAVPSRSDIITIGDSQTYGNNAHLEENWPSHMHRMLDLPPAFTHYGMALGGWGAPQYYYAFAKSTFLDPKLVVVAFYTGNDSIESFSMTYSVDAYSEFRPDTNLSLADIPPGPAFPVPLQDTWQVTFPDGSHTVFTPALRNYSNADHPVVDAGYAIMAEIAGAIVDIAREHSIEVVFTIIPTKETAYLRKVEASGMEIDPEYAALVASESRRIEALAHHLDQLGEAVYVDVVEVLQEAVAESALPLYPEDSDGHPLAEGYRTIAQGLAPEVRSRLRVQQEAMGAWAVRMPDDTVEIHLVNEEGRWRVDGPDLFEQNGWDPGAALDLINVSEFSGIPFRGSMREVDLARFGPRS